MYGVKKTNSAHIHTPVHYNLHQMAKTFRTVSTYGRKKTQFSNKSNNCCPATNNNNKRAIQEKSERKCAVITI